jgi:hypothetical protein
MNERRTVKTTGGLYTALRHSYFTVTFVTDADDKFQVPLKNQNLFLNPEIKGKMASSYCRMLLTVTKQRCLDIHVDRLASHRKIWNNGVVRYFHTPSSP